MPTSATMKLSLRWGTRIFGGIPCLGIETWGTRIRGETEKLSGLGAVFGGQGFVVKGADEEASDD